MNEPGVLGPCAEWEPEIVDLAEGVLAPARADALRAHLQACTRCRDWHATWLAVDAKLYAALPHPAPSPGFDRALFARIAAMTARDRGALRAAAEQEYAWLTGSLRRGLGLRTLGNGLAAAAVAGTALWLAQGWLAPWVERFVGLDPALRNLAFAGIVAACAAVALAQLARVRG
jgi:anti-sigma factor RsiW